MYELNVCDVYCASIYMMSVSRYRFSYFYSLLPCRSISPDYLSYSGQAREYPSLKIEEGV